MSTSNEKQLHGEDKARRIYANAIELALEVDNAKTLFVDRLIDVNQLVMRITDSARVYMDMYTAVVGDDPDSLVDAFNAFKKQ